MLLPPWHTHGAAACSLLVLYFSGEGDGSFWQRSLHMSKRNQLHGCMALGHHSAAAALWQRVMKVFMRTKHVPLTLPPDRGRPEKFRPVTTAPLQTRKGQGGEMQGALLTLVQP